MLSIIYSSSRETSIDFSKVYSLLLEELKLSKEGHLVVANDRLVTEDHRLEASDNVRVIRVVSGG